MSLGTFHGLWWALDQAYNNGNWQLLLISQRLASAWGWTSCLESSPVSEETSADVISYILLKSRVWPVPASKNILSSCVILRLNNSNCQVIWPLRKVKNRNMDIVPKCLFS